MSNTTAASPPTPPTSATRRTSSLAARCGPLSLLAAALLPFAGAVAITSTRVGVVAMAGVAVLAVLVVRDLRSTWWRVGVVLVAATSVAVSTWLYGGQDVDTTGGAALRILYLVLPSALLTPYLDPIALGDHLAQRLRLPGRVVVVSVAALQRLDQLAQVREQVVRARRTRGLGGEAGPIARMRAAASVLFGVLVSTLRDSGRVAVAMDARGFASASRRTWAEPAPWRVPDWLMLAVGVGLAVLPWLLR
jgi:energy-coupling factor transporter transmembrane protein EcfT